jgi:two-component system nitrogen regulation response regulator GlnG
MPKRELTYNVIKNFTLDELLDIYIKKYLDNIDLTDDNNFIYKEFTKLLEKSLIKNTLEKTNYNKIKAAKILGINRNSLHKKVNELNIECKSRKSK